MALDPASLSVPELRRRLVEAGEPVGPKLLGRLRRDSRRGVRQIWATLEKRRQADQARRVRQERLLHLEQVLWRSGVERVAGVDEAGVGPLAGPVVAAAVVFRPGTFLDGVDDSKKLEPEVREELAAAIRATAAGVGVGVAAVEEIDAWNVYQAALVAMRRAVEALPEMPQHLLVDARTIPGLAVPQNPFDKGDGIDFSIAAASIIAKVHRDTLMVELDRAHPAYGFARHKGYATADHQEAIRRHGPCALHRRSYAYIHELCGESSADFYALQQRIAGAGDRESLLALEGDLAGRRDALPEVEHRRLRTALKRRWELLASAR
jgi:ribonuclease HII